MKCISIVFFLMSFMSQSSAQQIVVEGALQLNEKSQWFEVAHQSKGVILLAHGLNMKPSKMDSLSKFFHSEGYDVYRIALSGHRGDLQEMREVTKEKWKTESLQHYEEAKKLALSKAVPLYFVGFSLGGLLYQELINTETHIIFERVVLFAPAISMHARTQLLKAVRIFKPQLMIFSMSPIEYRANVEGTSVGAYNVLFNAISNLRMQNFKASNIPTLLFIDPKDEVISYKGIMKIKNQFQLDQWNLVEVTNSSSTLSQSMHHIITDEAAVGTSQWNIIKDLIRQHFNYFGSPRR